MRPQTQTKHSCFGLKIAGLRPLNLRQFSVIISKNNFGTFESILLANDLQNKLAVSIYCINKNKYYFIDNERFFITETV